MIGLIKTIFGIKGAAWVVLAVAIVAAGGGFTAGRYSSAVTVAHAQTKVARCGEARAADNAAANGTAAGALSATVSGAAKADDTTGHRGDIRSNGYAKAQEEANHADTPNPAPPAVCPAAIRPAPLLRLLDGLRNADRAADRAGG